MITKLFALIFTIFLVLYQPSFLLGQKVSQQQDWNSVQALSTGTKLLIETKDGKQIKGTLNSVSATALNLSGKNAATDYNKDNIQRIYQLKGGSRTKAAAIGAAVGAGIGVGGAAIALGATGGSDEGSTIIATGIAVGAAIGAVIGLAAGKGSKRLLIYESK